jgi:hypothetical protein
MKYLAILFLLLLFAVRADAQVSSSPVTTLLNGVTTTGTSLEFDATRWGVLGLEVVISAGTATVGFQGAVDSNYYSAACFPVAGGASATSTSSSGAFRCTIAGLKSFRLNVSACSSCAVTAKVVGSGASANGI